MYVCHSEIYIHNKKYYRAMEKVGMQQNIMDLITKSMMLFELELRSEYIIFIQVSKMCFFTVIHEPTTAYFVSRFVVSISLTPIQYCCFISVDIIVRHCGCLGIPSKIHD